MNSRFLRWGIALAACVCVCAQPALGATLSPEVARGLAWLQAQVTSDGRVAGEASSTANVDQVRSEVATTLALLSPPAPHALLDQIVATSPLATELLARKAIVLQSASRPADATLAELAASQNADGGFGGEPGFASNPLDTAWALLAWAGQAQGHAAEIKAAVQWLAAAQQATGGWLSAHDGQDAYVSAMAIEALAAYRAQFALASPLSKGRSWLAAQKASNNSWGSDAQTAVVLRALLPAVSDARPYQGPIDALMAHQAPDGSWQSDAYTSAIVLRVLQMAAQPVTNPDLASTTGVIKDAATGSPIASATVSLNGGQQTVLTDSTGTFLFQALPPGEVRLDVSAAGYRGRETSTILAAGAAVDYGDVLLKKADASGVTVSGVVYFTPPYSARSVANAATVSVGNVSALSDSQGKYRLTGIPAGQLTLLATLSSGKFEQTFTAAEGDSIVLNPEIMSIRDTTKINVKVVDANSFSPLQNCIVSLNGVTYLTNAAGIASFAGYTTSYQPGANPLSVYRCTGYANVYSQVVVKLGEAVDLEVALTRQDAATGNFQLGGRVIDGSTGLPIPGATIALPSNTLSAVTNAEGFYRIQASSALTGRVTVTATASGYGAISQAIDNVSATNTMNVTLRRESSTQTTAELEVVVTDGVSGQPLQGAVVSISGANVRTLSTALDGVAKHAPASAGSTTVKISYPGRITSIASLDVKAGISYRVPVTLAADQAATISVHGVVTDTETLQPVAGAVIALAGASVASVQTDSAGRYELQDLTAGEYTLSVRKDAYQVFSQAIRLTQATHANIPLTPLAASAKTDWKLYGNVVDGDSFERISGVTVVVEEMVPGMGAVARYSAVSAADGGFDFSGLGSSSARLMIQAEGYDSVIAAVERDGRSAVNLGGITLNRSLKVAGPDLLLKAVDRTGVTVDPATYRASGKVSVIARNNSTFAAGAFDVSVFIDRDNDGALGATDTLISAQRLASGLAAGAERQIDFDLSGATFHFRDEPLSVMVDSQQEVPEAIESNNVQVLASSCAAGGNLQDVVICLDNSGSVWSFMPIEVEGAIKAIENPNIIPQDGSIRLTVTTSGQANWQPNSPNFPARVLTPASAASLVSSMKAWRDGGGTDYLETGARNMSTYLKTLTPASTSKTIILVGDGYWAGGGTATTSKVAETVANGVTRIDLIGVGNVNMPELLDNAWPKPANTPGGGNVSVARSSGEIAGAMAQSLGNAVRLTDLSVGGLRIEDAGQGRSASLLARVGNGGRTSLASTLRFYHGARLLGEVPVPELATGAFIDLRLDGVSVSGDGDLRAVVDETKANSECNLSNNVHAIALLAARPVAQIAVSTDRPTYAMGEPVSLHAVGTNKGAVPAEFKMKLRIEDASGTEVLAFAEQDLGVVASGAEVTQNEVWASAGFRAGAYALVGTLMASDGSVVAEDRAAFAVSASAGASLRTTTDKASYGAGEWVALNAFISNLAVNASLSGARVSLKVIDPKGAVVYTMTRSLGEIGAMATREIVLPKALMAAATGRYVVESVLSSAQGQTLAQGRTFFDVSADVSTVLAGQVDLSRDILQRGDLQLRGDTIHNRSGLAIGALKIARVILRESDGKEVHRVESSLAFAAGETKRLPPLSIESLNLAQGNYIAVLQVAQTAQIQRSRKRIQAAEPTGWQVLSAASFLVTESAVTPLTPAAPTPVPTLSDFALLMLAALLGLMAWACRPARG